MTFVTYSCCVVNVICQNHLIPIPIPRIKIGTILNENSLDFFNPLWYCCVLQRRCGNGTDEFRRIVQRRKCGRKVRHYGRSDERLPLKWASG